MVRHGQGWTRFHQRSRGLDQELLLLVPPADPIKVICLTVRNLGKQPRKLSATFWADLVLGTQRDFAPMQVVCSVDATCGALLARNVWNSDFANRVAFAATSPPDYTLTADRGEFLGRNGTPAAPAALGRVRLSGTVKPLLDPCAAFMVPLEVPPGEEREVVFFLGQTGDEEGVRQLLEKYRSAGRVAQTLEEVKRHWDGILGAVQVKTPDPALDVLLTRWLLYQVLSCRLWGRSAFYQSGGAYGFRDQLQDVLALVPAAPQDTRAQQLPAASRQCLARDVPHWWHPHRGRGERTRFSADLRRLPLVACHYCTTTGDTGVLDERVPFLPPPPCCRRTARRTMGLARGVRYPGHSLRPLRAGPRITDCSWGPTACR